MAFSLMTKSEPKDGAVRPSRAVDALVAAIFASSMAFVDGTVVNVATAKLQVVFSATVGEVQWVVEGYALTLSALLLIGGRLGDIYGRRRTFIWGSILFGVSSFLCGASGSLTGLVFARAAQGVAAAVLIPGSLALITSAYPPAARARAIGIWSGTTAVMGAIGPFLGGWVIDHFSWRAAFYINLPLAVLSALFALRVEESRDLEDRRMPSWAGAASMVTAFVTLTYSLLEAQREGERAMLAALASAIFFFLFAICERRAKAPLFPSVLLKTPMFVGVNVITLFLYAALSATMYFLPLNLIQVQHYAASEAGAALAPMILALFVLSPWTGSLLPRFGARWCLTVGCCVASAGYLGLCVPGVGGGYWSTFFVPMLILGVGMSICVSPLTTTVMNSAPDSQLGVASGINNAISRMAGLLAIAVFGLLLSLTFNYRLDIALRKLRLTPELQAQVDQQKPLLAAAHYAASSVDNAVQVSFVDAFRLLMASSAGLALVGAACSWWMLKSEEART